MPITEQTKEYFAFISYKREDEKWAKWLQNKLEHYKLPSNLNGRTDLPKEIRPIFRDQSELAGGVLADEINKALTNSKYLIVICSPRAAQSQWVGKEVQTFIDLGRTDRIIPFIIGGTAHAQNPEEECFPLTLLNLPPEQELLGINIDEMGRDAAAVKVVAQMFGLKFDTLWQRYEREKRFRRIAIIVAALLLAAIGVGAAIVFSRQNKRITEQNDRIRTQKNEIETQNENILKQNKQLRDNSIIMAAQLDSINRRDALIELQRDSIVQTNVLLTTERNNLKTANWKMMENQSRFISEKASFLVDEGDSYLAQRLLMEVLPNKELPNRPYTPEADKALRKAIRCNTTLLQGHTGQVKYAAFSPNDSFIVSASMDSTIRIWEVKTGVEIKALKGLTSEVLSAEFSPDGKRIVSTFSDGTARIWDLKSGALINTLIGHSNGVNHASYSPDGKQIVTASSDCLIKVWNAENGKLINTFEGHKSMIRRVSFSPDGKLIVSASADTTVMIWDAVSGKPLKVLSGHQDWVNSAEFSADGKLVVSAADDIKIWDVESGSLVQTFTLKDESNKPLYRHGSGVLSASFSSNNNYVVSSSYYDNKTIIWDVATGYPAQVINEQYPVFSVCYSHDGKKMISVVLDELNTIKLRGEGISENVSTIIGHKDKVISLAFSPDSRFLISASEDKTIKLWNVLTGELVESRYAWRQRKEDPVTSVTYSPNGEFIASAFEGYQTIKIWNSKSLGYVKTLEGRPKDDYYLLVASRFAYSPDGKFIAGASSNHGVVIWDVDKKTSYKCWLVIHELLIMLSLAQMGHGLYQQHTTIQPLYGMQKQVKLLKR